MSNTNVVCDACKNRGWIITMVDGEERAEECSCIPERKKAALLSLHLPKSNYPVQGSTKDEVYNLMRTMSPAEQAQVQTLMSKMSKYPWIYIVGKPNTYRQEVALYLGYESMQKGHSVYFISMGALIQELYSKNSYEAASQVLPSILAADLLILDDCFDKARTFTYSTNYHNSLLYTFLQSRRKSTIFVSVNPLGKVDTALFSSQIVNMLKDKIGVANNMVVRTGKKIDVSSIWEEC